MPDEKLFKVKRVDGPTTLWGRLIETGQTVEVPEAGVYGLTCQESNWAPADPAAKKVHDREHKAQVERTNPSLPEPPVEDTPEAPDEADSKEND